MLKEDRPGGNNSEKTPTPERPSGSRPPSSRESNLLLPFFSEIVLVEKYPPRETIPNARSDPFRQSDPPVPPRRKSPDPKDPRWRLMTPRPRGKPLDKPWHDPRLFISGRSPSTTRDAETTVNFRDTAEAAAIQPPADDFAEMASPPAVERPSRTARRLSLIPEVTPQEMRESYPGTAGSSSRRRKSLTPLSYFSELDAVEQFVEQAAVSPTEELPAELVVTTDEDVGGPAPVPLEARASAEHFLVPRHSICAGIKIEITPPSAIREVNNFILDTVIIEIPDDDQNSCGAAMPDEMSRVVNIQQLASSSAELRTITPDPSVASVMMQSPSSFDLTAVSAPLIPLLTTPSSPATSTPLDPTPTTAAPPMPPPAIRRRTKLIAINVRRQSLSAVPRPPKTVRFAPSPTRGIEYMIDESPSAAPDRHPHLFTEEMAMDTQTADDLETESEEPFTPGLLRVNDFSAKELLQVMGKWDVKLADERLAVSKFFEMKLVRIPAVHLDALDRPNSGSRSADIEMQEA